MVIELRLLRVDGQTQNERIVILFSRIKFSMSFNERCSFAHNADVLMSAPVPFAYLES